MREMDRSDKQARESVRDGSPSIWRTHWSPNETRRFILQTDRRILYTGQPYRRRWLHALEPRGHLLHNRFDHRWPFKARLPPARNGDPLPHG